MHLLRHLRYFLAILFLFALFSSGALAVDDTGSLSGTVLDPSGAAVPSATVTLQSIRTGTALQTVSGGTGRFLFPSVRPGEYTLRVSRQGFQERTISGLRVEVGSQLSVRVPLVVGDVTEQVSVESDNLLVERESISTSTVVNRALLDRMPLNGRSFQTLIELAPGVVIAPASIGSPGQFSVNGQRTNSNYFTIDGVSANVDVSASFTFSQQAVGTLPAFNSYGGTSSLANVDAVEEFRIQTSTFAPEYGRMPGGQVSIVTRGGTNELHGSLFHYLRNEKLDANNWFSNAAGLQRAPLRQNLFGFAVGGPVFLPKLYDGRNRTFFFLTYEGQRLRLPRFQDVLVPTQESRELAVAATRPLLSTFPLPNSPALPGDPAFTGRYRAAYGDPGSANVGAARIDHHFSQSLQAFFRASISPSETAQRVFINQQNVVLKRTDTYTGGLTWSVSPRSVFDLRANYSGGTGDWNFEALPIDGAELLPADALFPAGTNLSLSNAVLGISLQGFPNAINLTRGRVIRNLQRQWHFVPTLTHIRGAHELKFGVDWRQLSPVAGPRVASISYNFGGLQRAIDNQLVSTSLQSFAPEVNFRFHNLSWYAQDTWRVLPRLTLTYGLRHEINPPPSTADGTLPFTVQGLDNPLTATLAPAGTKMFQTPRGAFAPRVGAALLLRKDGSTVLRGGFGIYYDLGYGQAVAGYTSYPFGASRNAPGGTFPLTAEQAALPSPRGTFPVQADFYAFPDFQLPFTRQWNVTLEQVLGTGNVVSVAYVGNQGRRLSARTLLSNRPGSVRVNPEIFANFSRVFVLNNDANSDYHALQAQFRRALTRGLQVQAAYTWGKAMDEVSAEDIDGLPQEDLGFAINRGRANFDIRHNFTAAIVYDLPTGYANSLARAVLGGWGADAFLRFRSATPVDVITGTDNFLAGTTLAARPDLVPGQPLWMDDPLAPAGRRLNPGAFTAPPSTRQGVLGRNSIDGLNTLRQIDLSLRRNFALAESVGLEFRGELFNVFNTPSFGNPQTRLNNAQFGLATNMLSDSLGGFGVGGSALGFAPIFQIGGPRNIQLSLRLRF